MRRLNYGRKSRFFGRPVEYLFHWTGGNLMSLNLKERKADCERSIQKIQEVIINRAIVLKKYYA